MDGGAWWAAVHGAAKSRTQLSDWTELNWTERIKLNFFKNIIRQYERMLLLLLLSHFSRVWLLATPWTAGHQAPPYMGFSRQEYWSGVPLSSLTFPLYPLFKQFLSWTDVASYQMLLRWLYLFFCSCGVSHWLIHICWNIHVTLGESNLVMVYDHVLLDSVC